MGASQARRRLKNFGHGVRKVQTAGRNRAVVIHTATGQHLRELEGQFADVGFSAQEDPLWQPLESLPGISAIRTGMPEETADEAIPDVAGPMSSSPDMSPNDADRASP
jgi:hypothetical protein